MFDILKVIFDYLYIFFPKKKKSLYFLLDHREHLLGELIHVSLTKASEIN